MTALRHFLDIDSIAPRDLMRMIDDGLRRKNARGGRPHGARDDDAPLTGYTIALVFEKPSTRTRVSFEMAMRQMGGEAIVLDANQMQLNRGETMADTAQVMSRYVDAIMVRTSDHNNLLELASASTIPIINGLTDTTHPCQLMADIMTFVEHKGPIKDRVVAWSGDGNNVAASWIHAAVQFDFELRLACPKTHMPNAKILAWAKSKKGRITLTDDPKAACDGADCVVTDTWVSMGDKDEAARRRALKPYQVTASLMKRAAKDAIFMHCLPAHRGEEVTANVIDGRQSVVFDEAENRLHAQKAILHWCLLGTKSRTPPATPRSSKAKKSRKGRRS